MKYAHCVAFVILVATADCCAQSIDAFNPLPNGPPATLTLQSDGKIILAGNFLDIGTTARTRIARFNTDGSLDETFQDPGPDGEIRTVAMQADGKILIGGDFDAIGTAAHHSLARLNADGSLDTSFTDPGFDSTVWALALQPDGRIFAAGDFFNIGTTAQKYFARINANGTFDNSFANPQLCCNVARYVALQADGHVLVGGYFTQAGGVSHSYFARFSSNGTLDSSFPAVANAPLINSIFVAPDGSIYVAGVDQMLKFTASGALDSSFTSAETDSSINSFVLQPNGKILIGGIFQQVGGASHHALARLNANGSLDASFTEMNFSLDALNANGYIYGIAAQENGQIVTIGNFSLAKGQSRQFVARVVTGDAVVSTLTGQPSGNNVIVTWTRSGDGPELAQAPTLMHSTDGMNFAAVGTMTRTSSGWQFTAPYNFNGAPFYLQAAGTTNYGAGDGSLGRIASPVYSNDRIFADGFE